MMRDFNKRSNLMGFKVKGRRISHKPNETWRYSQNLVGGREEKPTERERERATAKERKNQRIIMRI